MLLDRLKKDFLKKEVFFKDDMILSRVKPHTEAVAHLEECCSGVTTANWYFAARYFGVAEDDKAKAVVAELKKLQVTDEKNGYLGCMRWYREETYIRDTNAAFFILLPLGLTYKFCKDRLTEEEKADILEMLANGSKWFAKAAKGSLHYCNKIMSDGAMLALIADITGRCGTECEEFWTKWHKYEEENGWGWGENTSDCYTTIMLNALNTVVICTEGELKKKAMEKRAKLLDYIVYHEGREFVPSIRTYNFEGDANYGGAVYAILKEAKTAEDKASSPNIPAMLTAALIYESGAKIGDQDKSNVRKERLFGDSYAYTWKSENIRLGSVSHFPVMPCSYQNKVDGPAGTQITYGLGWQSMPVSAMIDDKIGFFRIRTNVGGKRYCHPATDKHSAHIFNRLFEDGNTAVFSTISAQDNNLAVVARYANKLANTASFICDEWCFDGEISEVTVKDKKWFVAKKGKSAVAILPLDGIGAGETARKPLKTYISESDGFKTVTAELYSGESKLIFAPRLESVWVVIAAENTDELKAYLEKLEISDTVLRNFEITLGTEYKRRKISCTDGDSKAELFIDPVNQYDF